MKFTFLQFLFLTSFTSTVFSQSLHLNEVMSLNGYYLAEDRVAYPWIEFINKSGHSINLGEFYLSFDSSHLKQGLLPNVKIMSDDLYVVWLSGKGGLTHSSFTIPAGAQYLLLSNSDGQIVDQVPLSSMAMNESYGRRPHKFDEWIYYMDEEHVSPGKPNVDTGPWIKIQAHAAFPKGDAGYLGTVVYQDKMWILDYETLNDEGTDWILLTDVWNSPNGYDWELIGEETPYCHGAMFAVFKDYIWAFDGRAFRTKDGIHWEQMSYNTPAAERVLVFKDTLWILDRDALYKSHNGVDWEVALSPLPWSYREWPAFMVHNNKLWMFGGNKNYKTGNDYYFQDVWCSDDGLNWELKTAEAPWRGTFWFTYASNDGKIWMIDGGYSWHDRKNPYNGNNNEIWVSDDGAEWEKVITPVIWFQRHAQFTWVFKNEVYIGAGFAGGGPHHLYNDIWKFSKEPQTISLEKGLLSGTDRIEMVYGDTLGFVASSELPVTYEIQSPNLLVPHLDELRAANVGTSLLRVKQQGSYYFEEAEAEFEVSVEKKVLSVTPSDTTFTYGDRLQMPSVNYSGFVGEETPAELDKKPVVKLKDSVSIGSNVLMAEGGYDDHYKFHYLTGTLQLLKKDLFVRSSDITVWVGQEMPRPESIFEGFVFNDDTTVIDQLPVFSRSESFKRPGVYQLFLQDGQDDQYNFVYLPALMTVVDPGELVNAFPNPAKDHLQISSSHFNFSSVEVSNSLGQIILKHDLTGERELTLDTSTYQPGVYLLAVTSPAGRLTLKFLKTE